MGEDLASSANNITEEDSMVPQDNNIIDENIIIEENKNNNVPDIIADPDVEDQHQREVDLAIELEKRGKTIITNIDKKRELINITHLQGHFGVTSDFNTGNDDETVDDDVSDNTDGRIGISRSGTTPAPKS